MINLKLLQEDVCSGSHIFHTFTQEARFWPHVWSRYSMGSESMDISERTPLKNYMEKLKIIARGYVDLCGNILSESQWKCNHSVMLSIALVISPLPIAFNICPSSSWLIWFQNSTSCFFLNVLLFKQLVFGLFVQINKIRTFLANNCTNSMSNQF